MTNNLFGFFVSRMLFAVLAELIQFESIFKSLFIFCGKIVHSFALFAFQLDHVVLGHKFI